FQSPEHSYTKALLACRPTNNVGKKRLPVVSDFISTAESVNTPSGNTEVQSVDDIVALGNQIKTFDESQMRAGRVEIKQEPIISVQHLSKRYKSNRKLFAKPSPPFVAVDDVSFDIFRGETLGLVGESGCGKTTLSRTLLMLIPPSDGKILFNGSDIAQYNREQLRRLRKQIQIIFQDPYGALNPRITAGDAIAEVLLFHKVVSVKSAAYKRAGELLERVGLLPAHLQRYPHEFSGGQRQRLCIARALAVEPEVIVCDESVSALDVSVQAQVLNLLKDLQDEFKLTYLFISHDLSVIRFMCDRVMVMQYGKIVESNHVERLFSNPQTDYTQRLLAAIPGRAAAY
ncbi:MAG TPA: ATP-binding cassette domain-containing protein, partial [Chitinophagales bacterium]|nr:ATP-binding cassette domain-containing protein [Chitinophagales bacterium]